MTAGTVSYGRKEGRTKGGVKEGGGWADERPRVWLQVRLIGRQLRPIETN